MDVWYDTHADVPEQSRNSLAPTLWPPANAAELHLERCVRVLPHQQDTGAFFITKLRKLETAQVPAAAEEAKEIGAIGTENAKESETNGSAADTATVEGAEGEGEKEVEKDGEKKDDRQKHKQKKSAWESLIPIDDQSLVEGIGEFGSFCNLLVCRGVAAADG